MLFRIRLGRLYRVTRGRVRETVSWLALTYVIDVGRRYRQALQATKSDYMIIVDSFPQDALRGHMGLGENPIKELLEEMDLRYKPLELHRCGITQHRL
jgi:hypothetical protein